MSLDDRLAQILQTYHLTSFVTEEEAIKALKELQGSVSKETRYAVGQIKQAFAYEGYVQDDGHKLVENNVAGVSDED